jgi:hypothetical protein
MASVNSRSAAKLIARLLLRLSSIGCWPRANARVEAQLSVLPPQPLQLRRLLRRGPRPLPAVDLGLPDPLAQRQIRSVDRVIQAALACPFMLALTSSSGRRRADG